MIRRLIAIAVQARWAVISLVAIVSLFGAWQLLRLPIDAVPDITNKQVQINTIAPALSPVDMEKRVTFPIETALAGIPGLHSTRSISRNGFSQVTAVFEDRTDLYFARQQVGERLTQSKQALPEGVQPQIGPVTTGLGEVYMYAIDYAPEARSGPFRTPEGEVLTDETARGGYLRTVQDWIIAPQLKTVAGVAGVDSIGGFEKQYVVEPDPVKLVAYGVSYSGLAQALRTANLSVGADFFNRGGEAYLVRADARIRSLDDISRAVIATRGGTPVTIRDVAAVRLGGELRTGAASMDGREVVIGTALMLVGENSRTVAKSVGERLAVIMKSLPPGVTVTPVLDRSRLVNITIATVARNLAEGALLVAASLFFLLGNARAALIAVLVIPVSFLMTAIGMNQLHVSGNLMSLGALDFGLIVDGSVIVIENALRRLAERQHEVGRTLNLSERLEETRSAAQEMVRPTVYGQGIIFIVFAPLFVFSGVEGKTFTPMAMTLMLALASAFVLSLTFVPAMVAVLVRGAITEKETGLIAGFRQRYEPVLRRSIETPWPFIGGAAAVFVTALAVFTFLGQEFIPQLDEGDFLVGSARIPSTPLEQSAAMQRGVERAISGLPEVAVMFSKTGTAEVASDPMTPNLSDGFVLLKEKKEWPGDVHSKADIAARLESKLSGQIGQSYELTQPIQMRFNELIAGVRGDVAIKLYGDDLDLMSATAERIGGVLSATEGGADVKVEQVSGAPTLDVQFNRAAIASFGLTVESVAETVAAAMAGRPAGELFDGDRRFPVTVRAPLAARVDLDTLRALPVMLPSADGGAQRSIPLSQLATFRFTEGLNQISRENGKRRVVISANVRGRDIGSFVRAVRPHVEAVPVPPGAWIEWGGQFQNLKAATQRIGTAAPICFLAIFGLLYLAVGAGGAAAVFTAVPFSLAGGVFALALTGIPFSVSAAVGFICLSGVAVLNGLVVMTSIRERLKAGSPLNEAIAAGALERVRPVIMTGLVPAIGFIPMAVASGAGAEVQKPLAIVVIGGLITATALTLLVLPGLTQVILHKRGRPDDL